MQHEISYANQNNPYSPTTILSIITHNGIYLVVFVVPLSEGGSAEYVKAVRCGTSVLAARRSVHRRIKGHTMATFNPKGTECSNITVRPDGAIFDILLVKTYFYCTFQLFTIFLKICMNDFVCLSLFYISFDIWCG